MRYQTLASVSLDSADPSAQTLKQVRSSMNATTERTEWTMYSLAVAQGH